MLNKQLIEAVRKNNFSEAQTLIRQGAGVNSVDVWGDRPIYIAIFNRSVKIINLLLDHGAKVNFGDSVLLSPLMYAIQINSAEIVKLLVNRGADVNYEYLGATPLTYSLYHNPSYDIAKTLIDHGADVNNMNTSSITPLMIVCSSGNENLINLLLSRGANINIRNRDGKTAFDILQEKHPHIYEKIQKDIFLMANDKLWTLTDGNIEASTQRDMAEYMGIRKGGRKKTKQRRSVKRGKTRSRRRRQ